MQPHLTSNKLSRGAMAPSFAVQTDHPFHPLSFELQQKAPQTKQRMQALWAEYAGTQHVPAQALLFSEWPLVASQGLQKKLTERAMALCKTLAPRLQSDLARAQGWEHGSPPDVLTIDYAIVHEAGQSDGEADWDLRLVEFQAFTSLISMGYRLHQVHSQLWPQLADCPPWQQLGSEQAWLDRSRDWLAGGDHPALLEFQPWQRGTLFDLHAASLLWKLPIIEPQQIQIDAVGNVYSNQAGTLRKHDKILNRLILSELKDDQQFLKQLQASKLRWHSHPAWYFLVQKGLAADIKIPLEPRNVTGHQWRDLALPAHQLVAKNMYSCGGKDLYIGPSAEELDHLPDPSQWLIQPRFRPYPVMRSQAGSPVYAEVRLIVQLPTMEVSNGVSHGVTSSAETRNEPYIAMQIVRMYCAEQASASFFQGREGEGASILHTPPAA